MKLSATLGIAVSVFALAACERTPPSLEDLPAFGPGQSFLSRSPNPPLGAEPIDTARAVEVFTDLCVQQLPTFSGTEAEAVAYGLAEGRALGNYFHPRENLSVSTRGVDCSMVFASNSYPQELEQALTSLGAEDTTVVFRSVTTSSGNEYYAVRIGPG